MLAVCLFVGSPTNSFAADDPVAAARRHFERGQNHYDLGEFAKALEEFREAYRLKEDPALMFNIGQCQFKLGDDRGALHSYRTFLRRSPTGGGSNRGAAAERIAEIEKRLGSAAAQGPPSNVEGGTPSPQNGAPPTQSPPPAAVVGSSSPSIVEPAPKVAEADRTPLLSPGAERGPQPVEVSPLTHRWWFWTAIGVVVVLGAVGIVAATSGGDTDVPATSLGSQRGF